MVDMEIFLKMKIARAERKVADMSLPDDVRIEWEGQLIALLEVRQLVETLKAEANKTPPKSV